MYRPQRRRLLLILPVALLALWPLAVASQSPASAIRLWARKPNIVLILADDFGYADLGIQGGNDTPPRISIRLRGAACRAPR